MGTAKKGNGVLQSRRARTALLALALFLISVSAHAFCTPFRVDRLDGATVSRLPEDYSLTLGGDDTLYQPFRLSREVERMALHIAPYPAGGPGELSLRILDAPGGIILSEKRWAAAELTDEGLFQADLKAGDVFELSFPLRTKWVKETVRGTAFRVAWRGCDVVDLLPRGEHVRLFQRDLSKPKYYPRPEDVVYTGAANYGPTQQSGKK